VPHINYRYHIYMSFKLPHLLTNFIIKFLIILAPATSVPLSHNYPKRALFLVPEDGARLLSRASWNQVAIRLPVFLGHRLFQGRINEFFCCFRLISSTVLDQFGALLTRILVLTNYFISISWMLDLWSLVLRP